LELPKIYERWVLIVLLNMLIYNFKFKPSNNDWNHMVADAIYNNKNIKNLKIKLIHNNGSYINFVYEKELFVEGREYPVRPDYVVYFNRKSSDNTYHNYTLVLDAKFYASINVLETVNDLKDNKDYKQGDNDNWVYIITSVSDLISNPLSNRIWSKQAYYGEAFLLNDTNDQLPNHRYGGIFLHPDVIKHPLNLDNLQRLFGMFLQTHGHNYCIACGLDHDGNPKENEFTNGVVHTCNNKKECGFKWTVNNCRKCHQPLYKNGFYWTYHMLSLNEPTKIDNIVCPECGDYFTSIRD
ncbi:nuclease domain-containing protein, partial [Psychrobacter arenosus]|uniref:nuclease domain-containing protein n=2 Tax=Psychrobacter arenosus TaxID=256326 RepID=UPI0039F0BC70